MEYPNIELPTHLDSLCIIFLSLSSRFHSTIYHLQLRGKNDNPFTQVTILKFLFNDDYPSISNFHVSSSPAWSYLDNNIYNKNENKLTLILNSASTALFIKEHYQISTRRPNFLSQINKTEVIFNSLQFSTNERELKSFLASNVSFSLHRRI